MLLALALHPLVLILLLFGDPLGLCLLLKDFLVVLGACPPLLLFPGLGIAGSLVDDSLLGESVLVSCLLLGPQRPGQLYVWRLHFGWLHPGRHPVY